MEPGARDQYQFGPFTLDLGRAALTSGDTAIALRPKSFDLLRFLVVHAGRLATRDELLSALWPRVIVTDDSLSRCVSDVRAALNDRDQTLLRTVPRRGYLFAAQVHRVTPPDAEVPGAPAPSTGEYATPRALLPHAVTPLLGREAEVVALNRLLDEHRLVTVVGPGGVGKSALARWVLHTRPQPAAGVCWVDLAALRESRRLAEVAAAALGLTLGSGDALQTLCSATARLSLTLVLDNVEHLRAPVAALAVRLLEAAPDLQLLVTSQVPLHLGPEAVHRLPPLEVPDSDATVEVARANGALVLFARRAAAVDARFLLTDQNVAHAVSVCQRLDGLPLAIEIAAACAPWVGLPRLASTLGERFRALSAAPGRSDARHASLLAAMEWSHALLDDTERLVFRRIAVFAHAFSLDMAQRVAADEAHDAWDVLRGIGGLVMSSLLTSTGGDAPRYRLLETPRAFAVEQLQAAAEEPLMRRRHAEAVCERFAAAHADHFSGRRTVDAWQDDIERDLDDARSALSWALAEAPELALALAPGFSLALANRFPVERRAVLSSVEPLFREDSPAPLRAAWAVEAAFAWADVDPPRALRLATEAAAASRTLGDMPQLYRGLTIALYCRPADEADAIARDRVEMLAIEAPAWPAVIRRQGAHAMACTSSAAGRFDDALHWRGITLALTEQAGHGARLLVEQANLLDTLLAVGHLAEAVDCGEALMRQLASTRLATALPSARLNLAAALLAQGNVSRAHDIARDSWPQALQLGWQPYWLDYLALMAALEGRMPAAARLLGASGARYAALATSREVNEARAFSRAEGLVRGELAGSQVEALTAEGAQLTDDGVAREAFAPN